VRALSALEIDKLPRDVDALLGVIAKLHHQYSTILDSLHAQLTALRRMHFGASSERLSGQAELFAETVSVTAPSPAAALRRHYPAAHRRRAGTHPHGAALGLSRRRCPSER
jgi:hypothetical protein